MASVAVSPLLSIRVSFNKSLELQSHFHYWKKPHNNNTNVDWSQQGSKGKCMWWGIMISCLHLSGRPLNNMIYRKFEEAIWNCFEPIIVFPLRGNSLKESIFTRRPHIMYCTWNTRESIDIEWSWKLVMRHIQALDIHFELLGASWAQS